jgi:hypothetical protein
MVAAFKSGRKGLARPKAPSTMSRRRVDAPVETGAKEDELFSPYLEEPGAGKSIIPAGLKSFFWEYFSYEMARV